MRLMTLAGFLALSGTMLALGEKPQWLKFDPALAAAATNGRPICLYASANPDSGST